MVEYPEQCLFLHEGMLSKMVEYKIITADVANDAKFQYSIFLVMVVKEDKEQFIKFDKKKDRVDVFLWGFLESSSKYDSLKKVVILIILILSYGQAQVKRGFSINEKILVDNL